MDPASTNFESINKELAPNLGLDLTLTGILTGGKGFSLLDLAFFFVGLFFFASLIMAAFSYINGEGSPEKIAKANSRIVNSLTGLLIVLGAFALVRLVLAIIKL